MVSLLDYTDPNEPFILYTDAYDIAIGAALAQKVHCTPMVSTAVRQMMKLGCYVRCTNFLNAVFVQIAPFSTGKLLVILILFFSHLILSINSFEFMSAGFSPLDWSLGSIVENLHIFQYLSILDYSYFDNLFFFLYGHILLI